jgi:hypothetical protein
VSFLSIPNILPNQQKSLTRTAPPSGSEELKSSLTGGRSTVKLASITGCAPIAKGDAIAEIPRTRPAIGRTEASDLPSKPSHP